MNTMTAALSALTDEVPTLAPASMTTAVDFGAIKRKSAGKPKTHYPVLPDPDGSAGRLAANIINLDKKTKALKSQKALLCGLATPFYFTHHHGKVAPESSVLVASDSGEVMVTFANSYLAARSELPPRVQPFVRQGFELKVDGDLVPAASAQALVNELQALFARHNATDALTVNPKSVVKEEFHSVRHQLFGPADNLAINRVLPIKTSVRIR